MLAPMPFEAYGAHIPWQRFAEMLFTGYAEARLAKAKRDALDEEEVEEEVAADHILYVTFIQRIHFVVFWGVSFVNACPSRFGSELPRVC